MSHPMDVHAVHSLGGKELLETLRAATASLEESSDLLDDLNVFPVPDGDTGSNMVMSMRSALRACASASEDDASEVARCFARGSLIGARGNSGVILSQFWQGLAQALRGHKSLTTATLTRGLQEGCTLAVRAVSTPAEGTILTVMREVAEEAAKSQSDGDLIAFLEMATEAARRSVARTPELLPILSRAGVVDAGAQGLAIILEGALQHLQKRGGRAAVPARPRAPVRFPPVVAARQAEGEEPQYGRCTEFLLKGAALDIDAFRKVLEDMGRSVVIVSAGDVMRVHVHASNPGAILRAASAFGEPEQVRIRNMDRQSQELLHRREAGLGTRGTGRAAVAVVACVPGEGLGEVFRSLGAVATIDSRGDRKVLEGELLGTVDSVDAETVIFLPNDQGSLHASGPIRPFTSKSIETVPAVSVPQGLAAMIAFNGEESVDANLRRMKEALSTVRSIEIRQGASSPVDGTPGSGASQPVRPSCLGFLDGAQVAGASDLERALEEVLARIDLAQSRVLTLFYGSAFTQGEAEMLVKEVRRRYPALQVDVHAGGQPEPQLIASVE